MPWFLTSVISKETIARHPHYRQVNTRTFGFYDKYADALKAVIENRGNMKECIYDYLVMEHIEEGIQSIALQNFWFKWSDQANKWIELKECPPEYGGIINWALG